MGKIILNKSINDITNYLMNNYPNNYLAKGNKIIIKNDKWISFGLKIKNTSDGIELKTFWALTDNMKGAFILSILLGFIPAIMLAIVIEIFTRRFQNKVLRNLVEWNKFELKKKRTYSSGYNRLKTSF